MKTSYPALIALSLLATGLGACTQEQSVLNKPPGTYKHSTTTTDASGTTRKQDSTTEVDMDEYGNKRAVVKSKATKDPKGLFNKSTSSSTTVVEER